VGDAYDNALAESINGTYKTELIKRSRWKDGKDVEAGTAYWVEWYNAQRISRYDDWQSPDAKETQWYQSNAQVDVADV
jgi:transposase InsO family protein